MKRRRRSESGQAAVESAFSLLFFLAFLLVLADVSRICYNWVCLQYAINEAARYGSLGKKDGHENREQAIEKKVEDKAEELGLRDVKVTMIDKDGGATAGLPMTFYRLQAETKVKLTPLSEILAQLAGDVSGNWRVTVETLVRNEPFSEDES